MLNDHVCAIDELTAKLPGKVILPSDAEYLKAITVWAKPAFRPQAVVRCRDTADVQVALQAVRKAGLPLSVRAGGNDWAGRALCHGVVVDLTAMRDVVIAPDGTSARVGGGTRALDLTARTDALGLAPVTGAVGIVGLGGLTLGGGYGPLIARFGLASDNLLAAEVVLADGRIVMAGEGHDRELLWALRGGGGNFGVVTALSLRLHRCPGVYCGIVLYPVAEAAAVLGHFEAFCQSAPDELTAQIGFVSGPDGQPLVAVVPTWSGDPADGERQVAPLLALGTLIHADVKPRSLSQCLSLFDGPVTDTHNVVIETRWVARLSRDVVDLLVMQAAKRPTAACSIFTHEFRGAAVRVAPEATAFGFRQQHVLLEIVAQYDDEVSDGSPERAWTSETARLLDAVALAGGYANLLAREDPRVQQGYGPNAERLASAKRRYDPGNLFSSAIGLPAPGGYQQGL